MLEQAADGGWAAYSSEPSVIGGLGDTRAAAIQDWKEAATAWLKYMKDNGNEVHFPEAELVEVAA